MQNRPKRLSKPQPPITSDIQSITTSSNGGTRCNLCNRRILHGGTIHSGCSAHGKVSSLQLYSVPAHAKEVTLFPCTLLLALFLLFPVVVPALPEEISVGGIFDENGDPHNQIAFLHAVDRVNNLEILPENSKLVGHLERVPYGDSFHAGKKVCTMLEGGLAAIFGPQSPTTANHIQAVCDHFQVPRLETNWDFRRNRGKFSLNLYPNPEILSRAFADVITAWGWDKYIIVYENHESLIRLKEILHQSNVFNGRHVRVKQLPQNSNDYKPLFKEIRNTAGSSAIIIDCETEKLPKVFEDARAIGMMKDRRYFLTNLDVQVLSPNDFDPQDGLNITALSILDTERDAVKQVIQEWAEYGDWEFVEKSPGLPNNVLKTETALMYDAVMLLAKALADIDQEKEKPKKSGNDDDDDEDYDSGDKFETQNIDCKVPDDQWEDGQKLLEALRNTKLDGLTGSIEINPKTGFRTNLKLDVLELTRSGFSRIGIYDTSIESPNLEKRFTWTRSAEDTLKQQEEDLKDKTLVVTTILGNPYCTREADGNFTGYVPDLMDKIAGLLEFQYEIREVADGKYGSPDNETGEWNGMVGEVMKGVADMAVADLSISFNRQSAVDFTMPFMNLGISILYKTPAKDPPALFSFLEPFNPEVWICVLTAYLCISLVMYVLARLSPRDWQEPPPCSPDNGKILENPFCMSNCLWFSTGTIMGQGCDILPTAVCTRTATISWWFFVLIMISSYTANLAAFLANEGMGSSIKDVKDLPKQHKIKYGCVKGGTTCKFFEKNSFPLYKEIWIAMSSMKPDPFEERTPGGVDRVKKANGSYAFFMESTSLEYAIANDPECRLTQIGGLLDSKGYGIALRKNSQYRNAFSNAILMLAEKGELETLKKKWWAGTGECGNTEAPPGGATALTVDNVKGIFVVLIAGTFMSSVMSMLEFTWKARKLAKNVHESFWYAVWRDLKFAIFCQGETKPVRKVNLEQIIKDAFSSSQVNTKGSDNGSQLVSSNGSVPYLAFDEKSLK